MNENKTFFEKAKLNAIMSCINANDNARLKDIPRNYAAYGCTTTWIRVLIELGHNAESHCWEDENGCLQVSVTIDGEKY